MEYKKGGTYGTQQNEKNGVNGLSEGNLKKQITWDTEARREEVYYYNIFK
jgi:hypothetical protein